ncbi:MAG: hypothetical protein LBP63_05755 [Prevotellaceae bacterium]|jgi:uncharacterized membrane protein YqjE|nr:hypothetical protein [Prevotellaceae bacterium]
MNKKFVWTIKHTIGIGLLGILMLIVALFLDNGKLISHSISMLFTFIGVFIAHRYRIKSSIKDQELPLTKKQMLFIFLLLGLVILSIFFIKQFVTDKTQSIILICTLALVSGIFALIYVMNVIKKNKNKSKVN